MKMKISTLRNVIKEVLETVAGQDDAAEFDAALAAYANDWKNFTRETPEVDPTDAAEAAADGFFYDNPGWQKWSIGTGLSREDMAQAVVDAVYGAMMNGPMTESGEPEAQPDKSKLFQVILNNDKYSDAWETYTQARAHLVWARASGMSGHILTPDGEVKK